MSLFVRMLREEWRLHAELFGGRRFGAFPVAIAVMTGVATGLLAETGTDPEAVVGGLHWLAILFGLQVGTIGLVGRDALRDVLGDLTLLVFTARTLPLSWRRLLATFLVKDLAYYAVFVLAPVVAGFGAVAMAQGFAGSTVALAWVTVTLSFALGVTASLALTALASRSGVAVLGAVGLVAVSVTVLQVDPVALTPYRTYLAPSLDTFAVGTGSIVVLGTVGVLFFEPIEESNGSRRLWIERLLTRLAPDGMTRRPLLAVARSSGSVAKVVFSMGVMFAVVALVLERVGAATGLNPGAGIAFGTLLGLGAFTTYSWVTQFDDPGEYLRYPLPYRQVFAGMHRAYLYLSVGSGVAYLALASLWYDPVQLVVGIVVLPLVATYVFGVAAFLTGLSPNELLFDTPLFLAFGGALGLVALPLLVAALAWPEASALATGSALAVAVVAAVAGTVLRRRAGPRWEKRLRE